MRCPIVDLEAGNQGCITERAGWRKERWLRESGGLGMDAGHRQDQEQEREEPPHGADDT